MRRYLISLALVLLVAPARAKDKSVEQAAP